MQGNKLKAKEITMFTYKLFTGCLVLICLACTSPPKIPFEMPEVSRIQSIEIEDDFVSGWNPTPLIAHFNLWRKSDLWSGEANFTVGDPPISAQVNVVIPDEVMIKALEQFSKVKLSKKEYIPKLWATDYYPSRKFSIRLVSNSVVFFSYSQSRNFTPWQVTIAGESYVTKSSAASKAIDLLKPYLQYEIMDSLKAVHRERFPQFYG